MQKKNTVKTKPNNEEHVKDFEKKSVVLDAALELYNKLRSIY